MRNRPGKIIVPVPVRVAWRPGSVTAALLDLFFESQVISPVFPVIRGDPDRVLDTLECMEGVPLEVEDNGLRIPSRGISGVQEEDFVEPLHRPGEVTFPDKLHPLGIQGIALCFRVRMARGVTVSRLGGACCRSAIMAVICIFRGFRAAYGTEQSWFSLPRPDRVCITGVLSAYFVMTFLPSSQGFSLGPIIFRNCQAAPSIHVFPEYRRSVSSPALDLLYVLKLRVMP